MNPEDKRFLREPGHEHTQELEQPQRRTRGIKNLPSESNPEVSSDEMERALLRHCRGSARHSGPDATAA